MKSINGMGFLNSKLMIQILYLKLSDRVDIERLGPLTNWFFSGHDLASTIRRVNIGLHCLQSGAFLYGAQVGTMIKWCYDNPAYTETGKVHDSIRVAIFIMKILRRYLGDDFKPVAVSIAGRRENVDLYHEYFGCTIQWGQPRARKFGSLVNRGYPSINHHRIVKQIWR